MIPAAVFLYMLLVSGVPIEVAIRILVSVPFVF